MKVPYAIDSREYHTEAEDLANMVSLQDAMQERLGMSIPVSFDDGMDTHRFSTKGDNKNDGFYYARKYPNGLMVVSFGTWRDRSLDYTWKSKDDSMLTDEDRRQIVAFAKEEQERKEQEQKYASFKAEDYVLTSPRGKAGETPYAKKKNISKALCMSRFPTTADGQAIIVPVYRFDAKNHIYISAYQELWPQKKHNQKNGNFTGGWLLLGNGLPSASDVIYVCEGFATGVSIYEATGKYTLCVFSCGNYKNVLAAWKRAKGFDKQFIIIADNDKPREGETMGAGEKAARETGLTVKVCPSEKPGSTDANDFVNDGYNLSQWISTGEEIQTSEAVRNWIHEGNEIFSNLEPIHWLLKHWLPADGISIIYGPSNSGKSFLALDIMLSLATGEFDGKYHGDIALHPAPMLYLCGEGSTGAKIRMRAWCQEHNVGDLSNFFFAESPRDIDQLSDRDFILDQIYSLGIKPKMIFIDTLNRFYSGNENDSQEMRGFLNSLSYIQEKIGCGVCVVHHTGVNLDAQNRARGSSALKAAVDTEINVKQVRKGEDAFLIASQTKQRDDMYQKPIAFRFRTVQVEGLYDSDDKHPVNTAVLDPVSHEDAVSLGLFKEDGTTEAPDASSKDAKERWKAKKQEEAEAREKNESDALQAEFVLAFRNESRSYGHVDAMGHPYLRTDDFRHWMADFSNRADRTKGEDSVQKWASNQMSIPCGIIQRMMREGAIAIYDFSDDEASSLGISYRLGDSRRPRKIMFQGELEDILLESVQNG